MDMTATTRASLPDNILGEVPKPRITVKGVAIVLAIWWIYALVTSIATFQSFEIPFTTALLGQTLQSILKVILSLPVWFIVIRWMYREKWYWKGLAHVILGPLYAVLNYVYQYYTVVGFGSRVHEGSQNAPGWVLIFNLFIYAMQFILYHGYEIVRTLHAKEKIALELLALQKEQELAILKSQINPHFLFNTLHSISATVSTNTEETRTMIAQLGDMLRYVIEGTRSNLVPLQKELQFVRDYVDLESKRMGERLKVEFHIDQSVVTFPVPPMILQPLVENAIKHGLTPQVKGGRITVQVQRCKDTVAFRVADTGVGLSLSDPLSSAGGIGLKNIDTRLRRMYGDSAGLKIDSPKNAGCEVSFVLPSK
jgi:two-component system LytT family sensor kinase